MSVTEKIALIGDYNSSVTAHIAIPKALDIATKNNIHNLESTWIETTNLTNNINHLLAQYSGIWCVPGSPYKNTKGVLSAIQFARESKIPFLGTCGGYQHAILEYARHVLGFAEADNAETNPNTSMVLIAPLSCSLLEQSGNIFLTLNSQIAELYDSLEIEEKYNCSYGLNVKYISIFEGSDLLISGVDQEGDPKTIELKNHPFFIGTGYQPERSALLGNGHPLITAFVEAILA
jgi:CTP synthase (UTP-ammonia lyase)